MQYMLVRWLKTGSQLTNDCIKLEAWLLVS
jgi:hypothetical protein